MRDIGDECVVCVAVFLAFLGRGLIWLYIVDPRVLAADPRVLAADPHVLGAADPRRLSVGGLSVGGRAWNVCV